MNWSRPIRQDFVPRGGDGAWDYGFALGGTTLIDVESEEGWQTRYYYSSFAGEHVCNAAKVASGDCAVTTGRSHIGLITWAKDRFLSFRGSGQVTTRVLSPEGNRLRVNFDPGESGVLRVELLDGEGLRVAGYTRDEATPITIDARYPGAEVRWGDREGLPDLSGYRLRFHIEGGGELFAFAID